MTHRPKSYLAGLIGTGVGPSLTPPMHMAEGRAQGLDYVYRTIDLAGPDISPDRVGEVLGWCATLGFDAVNVTHPCKQIVLAHLDRVDPVAARLGAVNTVLFTAEGTVGHNTDTTGFARGARRCGRRGNRRRRRPAATGHRTPHRRGPRRRTGRRTGP